MAICRIEWCTGGYLESIQISVEEPAEIIAAFETTITFFLAENGVTIKCPSTKVGEIGLVDGVEYEAVDYELLNRQI